jgi:hypothetical protein
LVNDPERLALVLAKTAGSPGAAPLLDQWIAQLLAVDANAVSSAARSCGEGARVLLRQLGNAPGAESNGAARKDAGKDASKDASKDAGKDAGKAAQSAANGRPGGGL